MNLDSCRIGHRRKRARNGWQGEGIASLTAPPVSTVAEEVVTLLRKLHSLPDWNTSINGKGVECRPCLLIITDISKTKDV